MHDPEIQQYFEMLATQTRILLDTRIRLRLEKQLRVIQDAYFRNLMNRSREAHDSTLSASQCWGDIVQSFTGFLPSWPPFRLSRPPHVQILTFDRETPRFLLLRGTQGETKGESEVVDWQLRRENTICGLLVDKEDDRADHARQTVEAEDYLYLDPHDELDRYGSFLYGDIPHTELVVPIRDNGQLIAMINLEHPEPKAFCAYHIEVAQIAADLITPFVRALLAEESEERTRVARVHRDASRMLEKVKNVYHHKIGNSLGVVIQQNLNELVKNTEFDTISKERIALAKDSADKLISFSKNFFPNMEHLFKYGPINLELILKNSLLALNSDSNSVERVIDELKAITKIDLTISCDKIAFPEDVIVFASLFLREHIYNVVNNSLQILSERKSHETLEDGMISISIRKQDVKDNNDKIRETYAVLRVEDNAGGVSPENESKIFASRFSTRTGGSGFGLTAAREYMRSIFGDLILTDNKPG